MTANAQTQTATQPPAQRSWPGLLVGVILLIVLTLLVAEIDQAIANAFKERKVTNNPLEYPLTAVIIGFIANGVLRLVGRYQFVKPAIRTELYLKVGLVILGANISLGDLLAKGSAGLIQALIMVTSVFFFTWWLAGKIKMPDTLRAVMASAVSICGVSAAIAAAGAVMAKKEEVTYVTALVILTAIPLMVIMPWLADAMNLDATVAGAWFGGNIDTTAAVVGAGTIHGEVAQATASVVKLAQNVLIGFAAFGLALYFSLVIERGEKRPSPKVIWRRFPKFVIGFVLVSILASTEVFTPSMIAEMKIAYKWAFTLAFVCIGIDFSPGAVKSMGWKPVAVYLGATVFNTILALVVASIIFGTLAD